MGEWWFDSGAVSSTFLCYFQLEISLDQGISDNSMSVTVTAVIGLNTT